MRSVLALLLALSAYLDAGDVVSGVEARVWFSPNGGGTQAIVDAVGSARSSVLVQAYGFTSKPIAKALKAAKERGVDIRILVDKSQRSERYSVCDFLAHADIPILVDEKPAIAHSKVIIIDGQTVVTGSFNFTAAAEASNVENLLILTSNGLAATYTAAWQARATQSVPYQPIDTRPR